MVAVCVVPVSWVSHGGLEQTRCVGKEASSAVAAGGAREAEAAASAPGSRVLCDGPASGSRAPTLTDMVVPVEVVWCVSHGRLAGGG